MCSNSEAPHSSNAGVGGRLFAAPTTGPRFLLVFLRGGYDSTNLLVPYSSSYYYEARPNIAIAGPDPAIEHQRSDAKQRLGSGSRRGATRSARCICKDKSRSFHSPARMTCRAVTSRLRTASTWPASSGARDYRSGFLGRLSDTLMGTSNSSASISFTRRLPLASKGVGRCRTFHSRRGASRLLMSGNLAFSATCIRATV